MNVVQTFENFLATHTPQVSLSGFLVNLGITLVLALLLQAAYIRCGQSLSNRRRFANNFVMLALTTMLIITVVKSSLALSLGLVGALSIVRFRSAIKEPEELAFLFITIAVGLGLGAGQRAVTILGTLIILATVLVRKQFLKTNENQDLFLTITSEGANRMSLDAMMEILNQHCPRIELKRFDQQAEVLEAIYVVEFRTYEDLEKTRAAFTQKQPAIRLTFLDSKVS